MLRLIFTVFVTLSLLAGATLFLGTEEEVVRVGESLEPVVDRAVGFAARSAERLEEEVRAAAASRVGGVAGARALPPSVPEPEVVEVVTLGARAGDAFVEGPLPEAPVGAAPGSVESIGAVSAAPGSAEPIGAVSAAPRPAQPFDDVPPDPEAWADLIRRMLSLYARVGTEDR